MKPYVHLNCAMTADGKIATKDSTLKISGHDDLIRVHKLRKKYDAIMVGINTILVDNPRLSIHKINSEIEDNPTRIVIDSRARTPINSRVLNDDAETIIITSSKAKKEDVNRLSKKATVLSVGTDRVDLVGAMDKLYDLGIESILLEGGATLNYSMLEEKLVDKISVCIGSKILGGKDSITMVDGEGFDKENCVKLEIEDYYKLDDDIVIEYKVIH
ncbi:MAG: 2,5-diamino-6-(ribosylamino)-4(3H)-pyrimidinone 5'-phosphate reductase [Methanosphaera sp. rholeuAM130]|nr:MAG: 2,5-diamino-6-(ribosylamino)-4(3H)-pyrimidinone 5'-phosphate reductase [Methanosphaera sp. rholeuAM130]